jgi:pimeloyl-ACP methyl ester carboxylesterase
VKTAIGLLALVSLLIVPAATGRQDEDYCAKPGDAAVHLKASDGAEIYGLEIGKGATGVVFGHQFLSDHCEWVDFARRLARSGFRTLSIDFRGNGDSHVNGGSGTRLDRDVAAAVARLRSDGATKIKLVGASMGGTAVLVAASNIRPPVDGVVSLSGPASYNGLDALRAVRRSHVPVRFLVARGDIRFADDAATLMKAAAAHDKAIVRYGGAAHGSSLLGLPGATAYVTTFLRR